MSVGPLRKDDVGVASAGGTPSPAAREEGAGAPRTGAAPQVFSRSAFALAAAGMSCAPLAAGLVQALLAERVPREGAAVLTAMAAGAVALAGGYLAAWRGRRLGFYEISAATLALLALSLGALPVLPRLDALRVPIPDRAAQGALVAGLTLAAAALATGAACVMGAALGYLSTGSGRLDASLTWELPVAKRHLRLSPRTLLGLLLAVVTGVVPFAIAAAARAYRRERRAAAREGWRPRMPATLLMTLVAVGAVAIGTWALTVVLSLMGGYEGDLKARILGMNAHGVVLKYGQDDFEEWRQVRAKTLAVPGVAGATPFLYGEAMLSAGQAVGAVVKGIDLGTAGTVLELPRAILPGEGELEHLAHPERIRPAGDAVLPGIVVGRELARGLRVSVGDVVQVVSPRVGLAPSGPGPRSRAFRVAAVFSSGMYEQDSRFAYVDLAEAQRFFGAGGSVTGLELKVRDADEAPPIMGRVLVALEGYPYRTRHWGQLNRNLFSALMLQKVATAVILGFIVLVASFLIVATLVMQVLDKRREIAVLKAMGAGQPSIMKIFVAEGVVIGAVGTALGLVLGVGTCLLVDAVGVPLNPEIYSLSHLPVRMSAAEFGLVALLALALSFLATLYPASKASRLEPVEGLRDG